MESCRHAAAAVLVIAFPVRLAVMHGFSCQCQKVPTTLILFIDEGSELQRNQVTKTSCLGNSALHLCP